MAASCPSSLFMGEVSYSQPARTSRAYHSSNFAPQQSEETANSPALARVVIADPEPVFLDGLAAVFARQSDMQVVGRAGCGQDALDMFSALRPDVLVMEARFPDLSGRDIITTLLRRFPAAVVLVFSRHEEEESIYRLLQAGAKGYYFKDVQGTLLVEAVWRVCAGHRAMHPRVSEKLAGRLQRAELSRREIQVLEQIVEGCSNQELGLKLFIAEGTAKAHVNNIFYKLGVNDRTQAVVAALRRGLVSL